MLLSVRNGRGIKHDLVTQIAVQRLKQLILERLLVTIMVFLITSCGTISTPNSVASSKAVPTRLTARLYDKLVLEDNCLHVKSGYSDTSYLLVWPPEFVARMENGIVYIRDALAGKEVEWNVDGFVMLGGGEAHTLSDGEHPLFSTSCAGPLWLVGEVAIQASDTPTISR